MPLIPTEDTSVQAETRFRVNRLSELLEMVVPVPATWLAGTKRKAGGSKDSMDCLPCEKYATLINAWRKALKWTDGLDHALCAMLASVSSTKSVGDQLWLKVIGPASCLDGDTSIYDPKDGSTLTVAERQRRGKRFWVYSRKPNGKVGVAQALPPQKYPAVPMYEVRFASGRTMKVTYGHRFWNGESYVAVRTIADALQESSSYPLPTISGSCLQAQMQGALRSRKTTASCQSNYSACSYPYGGPPLPVSSTYREPSPLQGAIQERSQDTSDDRMEHVACSNRLHQLESPLSSYRKQNPYKPSPYGISGVSSVYGDVFLQYENWYPMLSHTLQSTIPLRRGLLTCRCVYPSSDKVFEKPLHTSEPGLRLYKSYGTFLRTPQSYTLFGSSLQWPEAVPYAEVSSQTDGKEPLLVSKHAGLASARYAESFQSLQKSYPQDIVQQPLQDVQETRGAWVTPLEVDSELDLSILSEIDAIVKVQYIGDKEYYDFSVPETKNYWACGLFNHNCGKSTLCEAVSVSKRFVLAKSTIRGFHSGFRMDQGGDDEDHSLISQLYNKTLVTKDGDTLLQSPNLSQILSEARDIYDSVSRTHYRNAKSKDYMGVRMTWILCGTSSLRQIDASELGERFLDVVIMEGIDDELEDEVLWRVTNRADRNLAIEADGKLESQYEPELANAMMLTGGYVEYLRENAQELLSAIDNPEWAKRLYTRLGKFVAYMRARPSTRQEETAEREFAARLVSQLTRLSKCIALVLNRKEVDDEVMRRVKKVALDTARGQTMAIASHLYNNPEGLETKTIVLYLAGTEEKTRALLRFLRRIHAVEFHTPKERDKDKRPRWRLTEKMRRLYREVMEENNAGIPANHG